MSRANRQPRAVAIAAPRPADDALAWAIPAFAVLLLWLVAAAALR